MALVKQCSTCSNKGIFLKLNDGICTTCFKRLNDLESLYTNILQKVALNNNYDTNTINILNNLLSDLSNYNTKFSNSIKNRCLDLLTSLNSQNHEENQLKQENLSDNISSNNIINLDFKKAKVKNVLEPVPLTINTDQTVNNSISLDFSSIIPTTDTHAEFIENKKIDIELMSTPIDTNIKTENLSTLPASFENKVIDTTINLSSNSFEYNSLNEKCTILEKTLKDLSSSTNLIAKSYFDIKSEFSSILEEANELNSKALKILEETKGILCIRTNKNENDLFSFFNYVAISLQTTGINPNTCNIIEISAYKIEYGEVSDSFYTLVNPIKSIKSTITSSTGISNSDVLNAPTIDIALKKLIEFIDSFDLLSYGAKFVDSFLNASFNKLTNTNLNIKNTCTMTLYKTRYKAYHGEIAKFFDISSCCYDLLSNSDLEYINSLSSISKSNAYAAYKVFEILKYRYK